MTWYQGLLKLLRSLSKLCNLLFRRYSIFPGSRHENDTMTDEKSLDEYEIARSKGIFVLEIENRRVRVQNAGKCD